MPKKDKRDGAKEDGADETPKKSRLEKLAAHWRKASAEERAAFLAEIAPERAAQTPVDIHSEAPLIANGRYLLPSTIRRVETVMRRRRMTPGAVMRELGFADRGAGLARALAVQASLRLSVIAALALWLEAQERE